MSSTWNRRGWLWAMAALVAIFGITVASLLQGTPRPVPQPLQAIQPGPSVTFGSIPVVQLDAGGQLESNMEAAVPAAASESSTPTVPPAEPPPRLLDKTGSGRAVAALAGGIAALLLGAAILVLRRKQLTNVMRVKSAATR